MTTFLALLNLIPLLVTSTNGNFEVFANNLSAEDQQFLVEENINSWESFDAHLRNNELSVLNNSGGPTITDSYTDVAVHLNTSYPNFVWTLDISDSKYTSDFSNHIPVDMGSTSFPSKDIENAIMLAGVEGKTDYGGCGPIAAMGILDYFARYLGYREIIVDPTDSDLRTLLAAEVLSNTYFSIFSSDEKGTLVWPWDVVSCFNKVIKNHGLNGVISASNSVTPFGLGEAHHLARIKRSIAKGIPVTLYTGNASGNGRFAKHYTNVFGYETWKGVSRSNGDIKMTKTFLKANMNWALGVAEYCDSDLLSFPLVGTIVYDHNLKNTTTFAASDFAEEFVNSNGNGQYFFYSINQPVTLSNGMNVNSTRLRASYIENKYLVLSPNRKNAGLAYIDLQFPHDVNSLTFGAALWSNLENIIGQTFKIQYWDYWDDCWKDHKEIDLSQLPKLTFTNTFSSFDLLFPKSTKRIRFISEHIRPNGDRNKGRICLDNFLIKYN